MRAGAAEAGRHAARLFRSTLVVTAVLAGILVAAAPFLCGVVFGSEFSAAAEPLRVLAVGSLGIVGAKVIGVALIAQRRPLLESASMGIGFVVAIVLYVLLIPPLGADGAAIGSAVAYTVAGVAAAAFLVRALGVPVGQLVPRPADVKTVVGIAARAARSRRPA